MSSTDPPPYRINLIIAAGSPIVTGRKPPTGPAPAYPRLKSQSFGQIEFTCPQTQTQLS